MSEDQSRRDDPRVPAGDPPSRDSAARNVSIVGWRNWGDHPVFVLFTVVATLGGLVLGYISLRDGGEAPAQTAISLDPCLAVIGRWDWLTTGGIVSVAEGGGLTFHLNDATPVPTFRGSWSCSERTGEIIMRWETGFSDQLTLSEDGSRLSGRNQQNGVVISAVRAR